MTKDIHEMTYDEIAEFAEEVITALRRRAYAEGYEQGTFDVAMMAKAKKLAEVALKETPQQKRDRIVEQAKSDVEELLNDYQLSEEETGLIVNRQKRTVVVLLKGYYSREVFAKGIAKCAPGDCFNVHLGRAIALRRALGLEVPDEYLNAPQPTEVRVGDVIRNEYLNYRGEGLGEYYSRIVTDIGDEKVRYSSGGFDYADVLESCEIVDDSREVSE